LKDIFVVVALILSMATMFTAHVAITYGLAFRTPRWRAAVGFVVPPLGLYWAWRERMKIRAFILVGALVLYIVATVVAKL
jgi:hypothetical protein